MSTLPSQDPQQPPQLNGSASSSSCPPTNVTVTDPVLLREVAEIAEKVRELEKSTPGQWEFSAHDRAQQLTVVEQDNKSGASGDAESVVSNVHTMSSREKEEEEGSVVTAREAEAQQSGDRLIIKSVESHKSYSGAVPDDSKSDVVAGTAIERMLCPTMNEGDIKALVKELKRKIEYTERMNWLCKYPPLSNFNHHRVITLSPFVELMSIASE